MPDPLTADPAVPHPVPVSASAVPDPDRTQASSSTIAPSNDNGLAPSSFSTAATAGSSSSHRTLSPPSLTSSSTSKAPPTVSGSRTVTLTMTTPPTTVGAGQMSPPPPPPRSIIAGMSPSGPTPNPNPPNSQLHVTEARKAIVASMSNMLDSELQSRASLLHSNAAALSRQEQDVARATDALRRENDKLAKVAKDASRKIKELGNVQNWAELLEMDFLVLEETMRLARDGDCDECCSQCSGSYWSGSESDDHAGDDEGGDSGGGKWESTEDKGKGKEVDGTTPPPNGYKVVTDQSPGSATSDPSPASSAMLSSTSATVSLDEALLESLADALTTDMRITPVSVDTSRPD
ncbi:hypothetical protein GGS20DRAFT_312856 [Poronia punctata]|nr:hypothetical protein GGS20DRAFT_312856 [Poronia punctata]